MIGSTRNVRVYACPAPTDMRKGYNGLFALARDVIKRNPLHGHVFVFVAKNRKRAKVLYWDGTGLCILQKRLEKGRFVALWERSKNLTITQSELMLFLEGATAVKQKLSPTPLFLQRN